MGIGELHCDCLALVLFDLATPSPRRRLFLVTLALSISSPRQRLVLTLTPGVDFDLDLVNARVWDGTGIIGFFKQLLKYCTLCKFLEALVFAFPT